MSMTYGWKKYFVDMDETNSLTLLTVICFFSLYIWENYYVSFVDDNQADYEHLVMVWSEACY